MKYILVQRNIFIPGNYIDSRKYIYLRNIYSFDCFSEEVRASALFYHPSSDLQTLVSRYNSVLSSKCVTIRPLSAWYTPEVSEEKRKRRGMERRWLKSGLEIDRINYVYQCRVVTNLIDKLKSSYYTAIIQENASDQKTLFTCVNKLLQKKTEQRYPTTQSNDIWRIVLLIFSMRKFLLYIKT